MNSCSTHSSLLNGLNLHLGCGNLKLPGFINIDINSEKADIKLDILNLSIFNSGMVDEIYNCHVLEHVSRNKLLSVLLEWNRILRIGGKLRIAVPDFEQVCKHYTKNKDLSLLVGFLNGGQRNQWDYHFINFDINILTELLSACGFTDIQRYDQEEFLGSLDDYSKSYIPHMDKSGQLLSLNVVCIKECNVLQPELNSKLKKFLKLI